MSKSLFPMPLLKIITLVVLAAATSRGLSAGEVIIQTASSSLFCELTGDCNLTITEASPTTWKLVAGSGTMIRWHDSSSYHFQMTIPKHIELLVYDRNNSNESTNVFISNLSVQYNVSVYGGLGTNNVMVNNVDCGDLQIWDDGGDRSIGVYGCTIDSELEVSSKAQEGDQNWIHMGSNTVSDKIEIRCDGGEQNVYQYGFTTANSFEVTNRYQQWSVVYGYISDLEVNGIRIDTPLSGLDVFDIDTNIMIVEDSTKTPYAWEDAVVTIKDVNAKYISVVGAPNELILQNLSLTETLEVQNNRTWSVDYPYQESIRRVEVRDVTTNPSYHTPNHIDLFLGNTNDVYIDDCQTTDFDLYRRAHHHSEVKISDVTCVNRFEFQNYGGPALAWLTEVTAARIDCIGEGNASDYHMFYCTSCHAPVINIDGSQSMGPCYVYLLNSTAINVDIRTGMADYDWVYVNQLSRKVGRGYAYLRADDYGGANDGLTAQNVYGFALTSPWGSKWYSGFEYVNTPY